MAECGIVIATDNEIATIEVSKSSVCSECNKKSKIGACDTCSNKDEIKNERYIAYNQAGATVGDKVEFLRAKGKNAIFAMIVFVLPIVTAILAYFVASNFIEDDTVISKIAITVFFVFMVFAGGYSYFASKKRCDYTITAIIE